MGKKKKQKKDDKQKIVDKKIKRFRIFMIILIAIWAIFVFYLSGQSGSESSGLSRRVVMLFTKNEDIINTVEPYVRKLAHYSEYGLGGILFIILFNTYEWSDERKLIVSTLIGAWYAITDEVHQYLVPFRVCSAVDVWIDTLGIATGVCCTYIIIKWIRLQRERKISK